MSPFYVNGTTLSTSGDAIIADNPEIPPSPRDRPCWNSKPIVQTPFLPPKAMDGVKVLDLGHGIPPAQAAKLLACFGADVIKVEPLDGDPLRRSGPFSGDLPHSETSGLFQYLNVNKKGVTLNSGLRARAARSFVALLSWADILVEGLGAGVIGRPRIPVRGD